RLSGPGSSVSVASSDAAFAQSVQDCGRVDGDVLGYLGQGPVSVVEVDRVVDLFGRTGRPSCRLPRSRGAGRARPRAALATASARTRRGRLWMRSRPGR